MATTSTSALSISKPDLKRRLQKILELQRRLQAQRQDHEHELSLNLKQIERSIQTGMVATNQRLSKLRQKRIASRQHIDRLSQSLDLSTPLSTIANELASIRDLSEKARSDSEAANQLVSRSQASIDQIGLAAGRLPAAAARRPNVRSQVAALATKAVGVTRSIEDQTEEDLAEEQGRKM